MAERSSINMWLMRGCLALICLLVVLFQLMPIASGDIDAVLASGEGSHAGGLQLPEEPLPWVGPDWILLLCFVWVLRRPDYVPAWLVAIIILLADFLLHRPPGLWAALVLIGLEFLRNRERTLRSATFPSEWISVSILVIILFVANGIILGIAGGPTTSWDLSLVQLVMTILFYPVVVVVTQTLLGVRNFAPGDLDAAGQI